MTPTPSSWPGSPACCLARSAREYSLLIARLEQEALDTGRSILRLSASAGHVLANPIPGQYRCLTYSEFEIFDKENLPALFATPPDAGIAVIVESPDLEQDHLLHELALTPGIKPVCIYRQDRMEAARLLQLVAEHQHVLSIDGWIDQLVQASETQEELPEFLNGPSRFRLITNSIPFLLAYMDRDTTYRFINDPFCQWFGLPRSAIIGRTMRDVIGDEAFEHARPYVQQALSGQKTSLINRIQHTDGSVHTAQMTYIPDRQPDGQVRGFISSIDDITRQVRVEEQLRQSEHRLRTVLANIPVVIFALDLDGVFTLSEGKGLQILGLTPGQVVGQSVFDIYRGNKPLLQHIYRALTGEAFQALVGDNNGHTFDTWYSPLVDGDGQMQGVLGISADVTDRVQTEMALKNSEERYRTLVENQGEGVMMVDADLRIEYVNLAVEALMKRRVQELIGTRLTTLFTSKQRAILQAEFEERKNGAKSSYELAYLTPFGDRLQLLITATPRFDPTGRFIGSFSVIRDITERKQVEEDLRYRSTHDALTGLHNRFFFDEELSRLEENHRQPISVLMLDMDGLKRVNDSRGHFAGDEALRQVAQLVRSCLRGDDLVARLGGDEFAVLLPNTRQRERDRIIARMYRVVKYYNQRNPGGPLSISIGGATAQPDESLRRALEEADRMLYEEKRKKSTLINHIE